MLVLIAASPQSPVESRMCLQTDLVKDNQDGGPHHDTGDESDGTPAPRPVFQVLRVQRIAVASLCTGSAIQASLYAFHPGHPLAR